MVANRQFQSRLPETRLEPSLTLKTEAWNQNLFFEELAIEVTPSTRISMTLAHLTFQYTMSKHSEKFRNVFGWHFRLEYLFPGDRKG